MKIHSRLLVENSELSPSCGGSESFWRRDACGGHLGELGTGRGEGGKEGVRKMELVHAYREGRETGT